MQAYGSMRGKPLRYSRNNNNEKDIVGLIGILNGMARLIGLTDSYLVTSFFIMSCSVFHQ
jgi:hypothetical protein